MSSQPPLSMPSNLGRSGQDRSWFASVRRCVIKIGSQALMDEAQRLDERPIISMVKQISALRRTGREIVLVSSGAVAAGLPGLSLERRPTDLPSLQAAAAVGQAQLMEVYRRHFFSHGLVVAQVLLTHDDLRSRERQLNARNTLHRLLQAGVVPIINENDTVAVDEIRVGDNDILSALVATMLQADVAILLTSSQGVYDAPPSSGGKVIPTIERVDDSVYAMVSPTRTALGVGGMRTKLQAADMVARCGERAVIAGADEPNVLTRLFAGEPLGTQFLPRQEKLEGRKRWIAFFDRPRGSLHVDEGAAKALVENGRSLLAIGISRVEGTFLRGDPVCILDPAGREIARGLCNYGADDARTIAGRASKDIASLLGACEFPEVVHRDNLVIA